MDSATLDIGFVGETKADLASLARGLKQLTKTARLTPEFAATIQQVRRHLSDVSNKQGSEGFRKIPLGTTDNVIAKKRATGDDDEASKKTWKFSKVIKQNKTCRLCEARTSFKTTELLHDHYTHFHKIDTVLLDKLYIILKDEKKPYLNTSIAKHKRKKITAKTRNRWPCSICTSTFSFKTNLKRHIMTLHAKKDCKLEQTLAIEALSNSKYDKYFTKTVEANLSKAAKYKCCFCHKELAAIYKHYSGIHNIEYPEQIMFDNGNVLVLSNIDTKKGQAPWFVKERENAKKHSTGTCKLCLITFRTPDLLDKHYKCGHTIKPDALENLKLLFRAQKGAHVADLPASIITGKRKRSSHSPNRGEEDKQEIKCRRISSNVVHETPANQKSTECVANLQCEKDRVVASNVKCDRPQAAPNDKSPVRSAEILRENRQPMVVLEDIATLFCDQYKGCIMKSDKPHASKPQTVTADGDNKCKPRHEENEGSVGSFGNTCGITEHVGKDKDIVKAWNSDDFCFSTRFCSLSPVSVNVEVDGRKEDPQNDRNTFGNKDENNSAQRVINANSAINNIPQQNVVQKEFNKTNKRFSDMEHDFIHDIQNPCKEIKKATKKSDVNGKGRTASENTTNKGKYNKIAAYVAIGLVTDNDNEDLVTDNDNEDLVTDNEDGDASKSRLSSRHILSQMLMNVDSKAIGSDEGKLMPMRGVNEDTETIKDALKEDENMALA